MRKGVLVIFLNFVEFFMKAEEQYLATPLKLTGREREEMCSTHRVNELSLKQAKVNKRILVYITSPNTLHSHTNIHTYSA